MTTPALDAPGRLVAGRYRLSRAIATGGMGQVWRGWDERAERPVAVKVLRPEFVSEPAFVERFRAEARTAGQLDHPNVATVVDYGEQTGPHGEPTGAYLVMELVDGEPLSTILRRERPLQECRVLDLLAQAGAGLQAAHDAGIVHRDVKPANLLVTADGLVKITDFGISRATGALSLTRAGTVLGTAHYLSPEQVQGHPAGPASDLYALGVVAFECLSGRRPFVGDSPLEIALAHQRDPVPALPPTVHPAVAALVTRALAKAPADRHRSAGAFGRTAAAIRGTLYAEPGSAPPDRPAVSMTGGAGNASGGSTAIDLGGADDPAGPVAHVAHVARVAPRRTTREPRQRTVLRLPLLVLAGLLIAALTVVIVGGHSRHHAPTPAAPATALPLTPSAFIGRPAATVLAALRARGLVATTRAVAAAGKPGTVVTVVTGAGAPLPATLPAGSAVVVQVVGAG